MSALTVVDCTLRDGGFHNRWDFEPELVTAYLAAVDAAGVDWAEVGYRSLDASGFAGALRYCDEDTLAALPALATTRLALMLDARELVGKEAVVERLFGPAAASRVGLVRVATGPGHVATALDALARLHALGYRTSINLMAWPTLAPDTRAAILAEVMGHAAVDVVYLADSYGSLYPDEVAALAAPLAAGPKPWGIHLHDNLTLAFANALAARAAGASWIDGSVLGMGRGAGNLASELWLQHVAAREGLVRYRAGPLHELVGKAMQPLRARYGWGSSPPYALSAQLGMHPMYAQELLESQRYTPSEVSAILRAVHAAGAARAFSRPALDAAISARPSPPATRSSVRPLTGPTTAAPAPAAAPRPLAAWRGGDWSARDVLIVGRGPSSRAHADAINRWVRAARPIVIECNHLPFIAASEDHLSAFILAANALVMDEQALAAGKAVLVGQAAGAASGAAPDGAVFVEPYRVESGRLDPATSTLPADVVSMFAIAQAVRLGATRIAVVGFDGYLAPDRAASARERRMQEELVAFFELLARDLPMVKVLSLTPTTFPVPVRSIYGELALRGVGP
ncbi:MAG: hypothetical protein U1F43_21300 [Myxococcota bacterium]